MNLIRHELHTENEELMHERSKEKYIEATAETQHRVRFFLLYGQKEVLGLEEGRALWVDGCSRHNGNDFVLVLQQN